MFVHPLRRGGSDFRTYILWCQYGNGSGMGANERDATCRARQREKGLACGGSVLYTQISRSKSLQHFWKTSASFSKRILRSLQTFPVQLTISCQQTYNILAAYSS